MAIHVLLSTILITALGAWLGYAAISAIRSGVAGAKGILYPRAKHPVMFWLTVTVQIGFTVLCLYVMARQMKNLIPTVLASVTDESRPPSVRKRVDARKRIPPEGHASACPCFAAAVSLHLIH